MNKLKISIIGTGHLGSIHCKLLAQNSGVDFIGVYDVDIKKSSEIGKLYNISIFNSLKEIIDNSDAVILVAPTIYHYDIAKQIMEAGKHCFIEKPVCSNLKDACKLLELEKKNNNLKIQIGHIERFNSAVKEISKYNVSPQFIEAHRLSQFNSRATDVSVIHDLMIHDIDLSLFLINSKIKDIDANGVSIITNKIDLANARIKFENGVVANLTASRVSAKSMRKFRIFQKYGYFSLDLMKGETEIFKIVDDSNSSMTNLLGSIPELEGKNIVYEKPKISKINAMADEQQSFIDSIINDRVVKCTLQEGLKALEIAEIISNLIENNDNS
jgi:predicted dehydrogenase